MHLLILYAEGEVAEEFQVAVHYILGTTVAENAYACLYHSGVFDKDAYWTFNASHNVMTTSDTFSCFQNSALDMCECGALCQFPTGRKGLDLSWCLKWTCARIFLTTFVRAFLVFLAAVLESGAGEDSLCKLGWQFSALLMFLAAVSGWEDAEFAAFSEPFLLRLACKHVFGLDFLVDTASGLSFSASLPRPRGRNLLDRYANPLHAR